MSIASEPEQHFFRSQRLKLCYWSWGDPAHPPVILQHGGRDHGRSWDRIAEALADEYYVVAPDLRGHGDSDWEIGGEYSTPQAVVDLMSLIDEVGAPVNMVAHSYGGLLTYLAAGSYPDRFRSIVSIEGRISGRSNEPEPMNPQALRKTIEARRDLEQRMPHRYATLDDATERMHESNRRLTPEMAHHLAVYGVRDAEDADGGLVWKFDNWARPGVRRDDVSPNEGESFAEAIECPVLLIVGDQSGGLRNQQDDIKFFRDGRAVLVPDAAHWVHHDQPATVIAKARAFFAAVAAPA